MRTVKASLKVNKNGKLFCTLHNTYRVTKPPKTECKICWILYNNLAKQDIIDEILQEHAANKALLRHPNDSN